MKTLSSNKPKMLLMRGSMTLLVFVAVVIICLVPSPGIFASSTTSKVVPKVRLGKTSNTKFNAYCYKLLVQGIATKASDCLKKSSKSMTFLKRVMPASSYATWPQKASLNTLAQQGQLADPQTKHSIKTQQDFATTVNSESPDLSSLFSGDIGSQLLAALWDYVLTSDNAPPPPAQPVNASDQPPSCPGDFQSFQNSDLWPTVGPMLLTAASQSLQDQSGNHPGVYEIYGRLFLQNSCSVGTFGLTMKSLNGNTQVTADTVSQWERDTLATAINSPSLVNNPSIKGVFCLLSQSDNSLVDNWFSAAIMTHPIAELTSSNTPSTSGGTPTSDPNNVHVEVAAPKK